MVKQTIIYLSIFISFAFCGNKTTTNLPSNNKSATTTTTIADTTIQVAASQFEKYLPILKNKNVALLVNQTSMVGHTHLVDTLLSYGVNIKTIFSPEHGFRGDADAGEKIDNSIDSKTGIPLISLYGKTKKPTQGMLENIDVVVFDVQDVGVRFYTYISTMHYVMEACAESNKKLVILDRPNPNGSYVDGPVLELKHQSFVGMHPIPIVHGLTVGELAQMINGEGWLDNSTKCDVTIIKTANYNHQKLYSLPIKPSPNLPNDVSIALYPSLCLFEGTKISVGRGTHFPFQIIGYPHKSFGDFTFTPQRIEGMSKYPKHQDKLCNGIDLRTSNSEAKFSLKHLIAFYNMHTALYAEHDDKEMFFNGFFTKLAGTDKLRKQIESGMTEQEIKDSWKGNLDAYKKMRQQYLLYSN